MQRLKNLLPEAMTKEQLDACREVINGPRGKVPAPMQAWLRNPELADRLQRLGELLRFRTSLEPRLTELVILVVGRHWTSHVEWKAHKQHALREGIAPEIIDAIAARRAPSFGNDHKARVAYEIACSLLQTSRVPAELYERGIAQLGEAGVVELVCVMGYYCIVSFTLNIFAIGLPESAAVELGDPDYLPGTDA